MEPYRVKFHHGTVNHNILVQARSHEDAFAQVRLLAGVREEVEATVTPLAQAVENAAMRIVAAAERDDDCDVFAEAKRLISEEAELADVQPNELVAEVIFPGAYRQMTAMQWIREQGIEMFPERKS